MHRWFDRLPELAMAFAIGAAMSLWSSAIQQPASFLQIDASQYYLVANHFASGLVPTAEAPFVYRVGLPWLVAQVWPGDPVSGFRAVNLALTLLLPPLLWLWLRTGIQHAVVRLLVVTLFAAAWHGPVRYVYYNAGYVDPPFMALVLIGLTFLSGLDQKRGLGRLAFLTGLTMAGTLVREVMIVVPLSALWSGSAGRRNGHLMSWFLPSWWPALAAVAAGAMTIAWTHVAVVAVGARTYTGAVAQWIRKPPTAYLMSWFTSFGPVLSILVFDFQAVRADLRSNPSWLVFLLMCAGLAFVGGSDTERFVFWSMPIVYMLLGRAIERRLDVLRGPAIAISLLVAQAVSARVFWPMPDTRTSPVALAQSGDLASRSYSVLNRLFVIDDFHMNLWSSFGSRSFLLVRLAMYFVVTGLLVWGMSRREQRLRL